MPKGYIIAHVSVTNPEAYKEYIDRANPVFQRLEGKYVVRGGRSQVMEGETHDRHVVIEFSSYDAALAAYNDPEYTEIAEIRRQNADTVFIIVEGA